MAEVHAAQIIQINATTTAAHSASGTWELVKNRRKNIMR